MGEFSAPDKITDVCEKWSWCVESANFSTWRHLGECRPASPAGMQQASAGDPDCLGLPWNGISRLFKADAALLLAL